MALWVKKDSTTWVPVKTTSSWVKVLNGAYADTVPTTAWKKIKRIWVKTTGNIWKAFYPYSGPFSDVSPILSKNSNGTTYYGDVVMGTIPYPYTAPSVSNVYVPTTLYGDSGVWNEGGLSINGFNLRLYGYTTETALSGSTALVLDGASSTLLSVGVKNTTNGTFTGDKESITNPISIPVKESFDNLYLQYHVTANTTSSIPGVDTSDSYLNPAGNPPVRIKIIKNPPINLTAYVGSSSTLGATTYYYSSWQTAEGYSPDVTKTKVEWWVHPTESLSSSITIRSGGYNIKTDMPAVAGSYSFAFPSTDPTNIYTGKYLYIIETCYNSGSITGVESVTAGGPIVGPPVVPVISPTTGVEGVDLFSTNLTATGSISYKYQWRYYNGGVFGLQGWSAIIGATSPTYTPNPNYVSLYGTGLKVSVITLYNSSPTTEVLSSNQATISRTPVIPTVIIAANSNITDTTGQINWTSTNQYGFSVDGAFAASASPNTTTGVYKSGLTASTSYTGTITIISSTGHTATTSYSLTTAPIPQYTVTWLSYGGTGGGTTSQNPGVSHTAPSPGARDGYTFSAYYNTAVGDFTYGPIASGGPFTPPNSMTMAARWAANTYTISYNGNTSTGGSTGLGSYTTGGSPYNIAVNGFTKTGYSFSGWNTAANGAGTSYSPGASYSSFANLTLYAQWSPVTYTITWSPNGGSVSPSSSSGVYGTIVTSPTPTYAGNNFLYWRDGTTVFNYVNQINPGGTWTITGDLTFIAWWTPSSVTYYTGTSSCNPFSGVYTSAPSVSGPFTAASIPTDTTTGTNPVVKTVYRLTSSDALSAAVNASCATAATAPSIPTGLSNGYSSGPSWSGSWSASTGTSPVTYWWTLYQSATNGGAQTASASGSTTGTSFTQSMSSANGLWAYFTVYATNSAGTSGTATSGWA
jgi:uncharacterized repeat protein (TIGR02543 family)